MSFDFYEELHTSKLTPRKLQKLCGVTLRTYQRWERDNTCPAYAQTIIRCYGYDMGWMHENWQGVYIDTYEGQMWIKDAPRPYSKTDILVIYHKWQWLHWYYEKWLQEKTPETRHTNNIIQREFSFSLDDTG